MSTITSLKKSYNPLTGKEIEIPEILEDISNIKAFVAKHPNKKVVVVQGLGFVGAVMSLVVANGLTEEYAVIGIDLPSEQSYWKIKSINEGIFPVVADDPNIELFYNNTRKKENFYATYDSFCYQLADIIVVDINLDVQKKSNFLKELESYDVDLSGFKKAMESIGKNCKQEVLILIETTVPPGTSKEIVYPIIKDCLTKRNLATDQFFLGHSYERVMPGPNYVNSIQNFYRVYSGIDERSANAVETFLRTIIKTDEYPLTRLNNTNATEMAKVLENSYRAMNIAFMVEWSRFAEEADVNIFDVVNAIRMRPTHKNLMLPGLGVGGYCLTKDPLLASWAKQNIFKSKEALGQSEKGVKINDQMPLFAFNFLKKSYPKDLKGKKVLLLGVSYLNDVGDTRYTPVEPFYNYLIEAGCEVALHDPHINIWEEKNINVNNDLANAMQPNIDIVIITTGHKDYRNSEFLKQNWLNNNNDLFIYDTIGVFSEDNIQEIRKKHPFKILGRGDI